MVTTDFRVSMHTDEKGVRQEVSTEEYKALLSQCGLTKVEKILSNEDGEVTVIPYLKMTEELKNAFHILFPRTCNIEDYDHDSPPMEALGLIWYAKQTVDWSKLRIKFHDVDPDPVVVGYYNDQEYLIAAWGPDKVDYDTFLQRARVKCKELLVKKVREAERAIVSVKADPEATVDEYMRRGGWLHLPFNV